MPLPTDSRAVSCREAFVVRGFTTWKNTTASFRSHEKSLFHGSAVKSLQDIKKINVTQSISAGIQREMQDARAALNKIFGTVKVLAQQGLAFRGDGDEETANLIEILKMRAEDCPELEKWLKRDEYK